MGSIELFYTGYCPTHQNGVRPKAVPFLLNTTVILCHSLQLSGCKSLPTTGLMASHQTAAIVPDAISASLVQVECLANRMLPYLPTALELLMHVSADCQDMCDVLALLNQLMLRFKAALQDLLKEVRPFAHCCRG